MSTGKVKRTIEQVQELVCAIDTDCRTLPKYNIFGESNKESLKELEGYLRELRFALRYGFIAENDDSEAAYWLAGKGTLGKDYGIE